MALILDRRIATNDAWRHARDDEAPPLGDLIVSLARWQSEKTALQERGVRIGVCLRPDDDVAELAPDLPDLWLVAIEFTLFNEGRCYSQARLLRDRHGFTGELRAVGDVARDRVAFMERCGFNALELRQGENPSAALAALEEITVSYQPQGVAAQLAASARGVRAAASA